MNTYCDNCGAPLGPNARFCPKCGRPVLADAGSGSEIDSYPPLPPQIEGTGPASNLPQTPQRSRRGCWVAVVVLGVVGCCAIFLCGIGALALYNLDAGLPTAQFELPAPASAIPLLPTLPPTLAPALPPAQPPALTATQPAAPSGQQRLSETEFFDDFSSETLDWYTTSDDHSQVGYENGAYAMEVKTPGYRTLVRPPVQYLTHLEFNAQVVQGADRGTFGVACYYVNLDNYSFVEIDIANREFNFGRLENGQRIDQDEWQSFSAFQEPLRFAVDCTPGLMALYINDDLIAEKPMEQPVQPHEMWLVVAAWPDGAPGGIKVLFDDIYGYKAMQ